MWHPWAAGDAPEELRGRLKWFLFGRVAVISCFLFVLALQYFRSSGRENQVSLDHLLIMVVGTYVFSMVSAVLLDRIHHLSIFTYVQVAFDICLITGVILFTGGIASPFPFLFALPILNGAGLLFARGAIVSALLSTTAYLGLLTAQAFDLLPYSGFPSPVPFDFQVALRVATNNLTFFIVAYLASVLTHRLHNMEELVRERQAERDRLAVLQETLGRTIGSGLITTDTEGRVTSADRVAADLCGRPIGEIVGNDLGSLFPPLQLTPSARRRFLQSSDGFDPIEFSHQTAAGHHTEFRCVSALLKDTYGNPIGVLHVLQDITRIKELEQQAVPITEVEALYREDLEAAAEIVESSDGLYGTSEPMAYVRHMIERVAGSDATVLITGESGTGKELVARAIHAHSLRRAKPFVAVNCGAIPEALIESEFFGHVKGAFTGAHADRAGCFRASDNGSIFLDEIGELPMHLQVKLLRVLQERVFRPVGSETNIAVNVRVIAATNRDLAHEIKIGRFREDLFYRLNVIAIELPALRDRREDLPLLIRHFLRQFSGMHGRNITRVSGAATRILLTFDYPGNIRELENVIEHAVAVCDGEAIEEAHLPAYLRNQEPVSIPNPQHTAILARPSNSKSKRVLSLANLDEDMAEYEKAIILHAIHEAGGVKKKAAEILGINYRSLRHRLQKYGIGSEKGDDSSEI